MPRIAMDCRDAFAPKPRGWGRYARELAGALGATEGVDLVRLTAGWPGPEALWEQLGFARAARRARAEVLHAPNCFLPLRRRGMPGVVTIHDLAWEEFPTDFAPRTRRKFAGVTPRAARSAQAVICPSAFTARDVVRRYGADPARVHVIAEAPALAAGTLAPPSGQYLLGIGDLREKKDWVTLVRGWLLLRNEGLPHRLVIAGEDAGEAAALRALAGDAPLELPGYVSDTRLDALLRGADVLVHPSRWEGFGLVVLEAMARGVPVVAARATSLPEVGADAACYFAAGEPAELAAVVADALARRDSLAAAGLARAAEFSWERAARETAAVYAAVAR